MLDVGLPPRFQILRKLGEGGMGVVYEAYDEERGARVALKTVRTLTPQSLARLKREFRALADLNHPNLVSLGELISEGSQWFFTMELVEGDDLLDYVRPLVSIRGREPLSAPESISSERTLASAPTLSVMRTTAEGVDPMRLRSALAQLAVGLEALHAAGMVHCDIKPSNVRVTPQGRVVLLDFGLVTDLAANVASTGAHMAGTPAYMAPEQAASNAVGPPADWYSVGVILYEALTGELPFAGTLLEMMMTKQQDGTAPSARAADVPPDLDALCTKLLRFDPAARPRAAEVLRALGASGAAQSSLPPSFTQPPPFVGRASELDALRTAFATSRKRAVTVLVSGESGLGKSYLVRHFVETLALEDRKVVVFAGRCYERETVPYKAFDGVVDALTRFLMHESETVTRGLMPTRPAALAQVFPVLRRVEAFASAWRERAEATDPLVTRSRAFSAMRETLTRLGDARPFVIVIDDLQWADANSLALLAEIVRAPDAPRLLLLATTRGAVGADRSAAAAIPRDAVSIPLDRLGPDDARDLAERLLARAAPGGGARAEAIAREADGHPFFIDALVRHVALVGDRAAGRLDDALWSSIRSLDATTRRMTELVAVAGAPITQEVLAAAAGASPEAFTKHVARLRVAHLIASTGARMSDTIEPYHDRVRAAVHAHLDDATLREHHDTLARAMERAGSKDAEALARHWQGAGNAHQAAKYAVMAGDAASLALAFDRAASSYEAALDAGAFAGEERRALYQKLAEAFANAGRGQPSARAFQKAAEGAPRTLALHLQCRGAEGLLRGGHVEEGLAAIRTVLATLDLELPRTVLGAAASLLWRRLWLRVRGLGFKRRDTSQVTAEQLTHVDICWSVAFSLGLVDNVRAAAFQARNLIIALRIGEPLRVARAMALEVPFLARGGSKTWARSQVVMEKASAIAESTGDELAKGWAIACCGSGHYLNGRFKLALDFMRRALEALRSYGTGVAWEVDMVSYVSLNCLVQLGSLRELALEVPRALREALERGDVYAAMNHRLGLTNLHWLVEDDPREARAQVEEAMRQWARNGFNVERYYEIRARTNILLYEGSAAEANDYIASHWGALQRSLVPWAIQNVRITADHARARSALAAAEAHADEGLLRVATRHANAVERERMPWATPQAKLVHAGIETVRRGKGSEERAVALVRESIAGFDATDMALNAAVARRCLGALLGGDEGRALVTAADAWMAGETVKNPVRMTTMLAPGFTRLW